MKPIRLFFFLFLFSPLCALAQTPQWAFHVAPSNGNVGTACKTAPNGNVYITGKFSGTADIDPGPGVYNITSNGADDIFLACYTSAGAFLWGFNIGGTDLDGGWTMTVDSSSNVIIGGYFRGQNIDFDPGPGTAYLSDQGLANEGTFPYGGDAFVAKYSPAGVFQWAKDIGGNSVYDIMLSLSVDALGYVYVGGENNNITVVSPTITFNSGLQGTGYMIKYDPNGVPIWGHNFGLPGTVSTNTQPDAMQVKGKYIYISGFFQGTANFDPWGGGAYLTSTGLYDAYIAKYDTAGNFVFVKPIIGNGSTDEANGLSLDAQSNIYITGFTNSSTITFAPSATVAAPGGGSNYDFFIAKYDSDGVYHWGTVLGGTGNDWNFEWGNPIDVAGSNVYVTGAFSGTVDFDPSASVANLVSNGLTDVYVARYDTAGHYICAFNVGSSSDDGGHAICHDPQGYLYVAGQFSGTNVDFNPGSSTLPLSASNTADVFFAKYSWNSSDTISGFATGDTICQGQPAHISITVTAGGTGPYTVTYTDGTNTYTQSNVQSGVPFPLAVNPSITTVYTITSVTDASVTLCAAPFSMPFGTATVLVHPTPTANAGDDTLICGSSTGYTLNGTGGGTYSWSPAWALNNTAIANPVVTATDTSILFQLVVTSAFGCIDSDTVTVTLANIDATMSILNIGCGADYTFAGADLNNNSNLTYTWHFGDMTTATGDSQSHTYLSSGTDTVVLIVTSPTGCADTVSTTEVVNPSLINSLIINTGYDPITGLAISGGLNGATPVPDPHWILQSVTPGVATAIALTPIAGLIEVVQGNSADVVTTGSSGGLWATFPTSGWISCLNSDTYMSDGIGTVYNMTLSRCFHMCSADSITFDLYIANDNYISSLDVDGVLTSFTQSSTNPPLTNFTQFSHLTFTRYLSTGTHCMNFVVNNLNAQFQEDPTGLNVHGTVTSATGAGSLVSEGSNCAAFVCNVPPLECDTIALVDTIHACPNSTVNLNPTITGITPISTVWTPATGLSNPNIANPVVTVGTTSTNYVLTVQAESDNLAVNSDFSQGNSGFTSNYTYVSGPGSLVPESVYAISTNPHNEHPSATSFGDHTTGTGNMMAINGANAPIDIWCETFNVQPNTDYNFSGWFANWSSTTTLPQLQLLINGTAFGGTFSVPATPGIWAQHSTLWNSGANTSVTVCIFDSQTAANGNDFAIDDITFEGICTTSDSVYVAVTPLPVVTLGNDTVLCQGQSLTLQSSVAYTSPTYLWSTGAVSPSVSVSATNNYWLHVTVNGCTGADTIHVAFHSLPVVALGNDTTICAGDTIILAATQPAGALYTWSTGSTADSILVFQAGNYWLRVTDSGCTSTDTVHVLVNPVPVVDLGNDTSVCQGQLLTLHSSVTYTNPIYLWSTNAITASIFPTVTNAYWLNVTVGGCTGSDTVNVTFNNAAIFSLGNDTTICNGDVLALAAVQAAGAQYLWSTGAVTDTVFVTQMGSYWLTITEPDGCKTSDTINVDFHSIPVVNLGPDTAVCQDHILTLQSSVVYPTATYLWTAGQATSSIGVTVAGTYWLNVTDSGCTGSDTVVVGYLLDSVQLFNGDTTLCKGAAIQVNALGSPGLSYQWIPGTGTTDPHAINPIIVPDTSVTYTLIASVPGCPDKIDSFKVDVQPTPVVYLGGNRNICQFDTIHVHADFTPPDYSAYTLSWTPTQGLDNTTLPNIVYSGNTNESLVLTVTTPDGCIGRDSLFITVHPGNFATLEPDHDTDICPHDSVQITMTGGDTYVWSPGLYLSDSTIGNPMVHPITSQNYSVVATSQYGCKDTLTFNVTVHPAAVMSLPDSALIFAGESYQISPVTNCTQFEWFPPNGLSQQYISNPIASPTVNTEYVVYAATEWNCTLVDSIKIYYDPTTILAMPNAFTPGTGPNNMLKIIKRGLATLNYYRVFDRWGVLVFQTNNIDEGWDGTYKGKPQPFGVYVYEILAITDLGATFEKHGNVTLIR